VEDGLKYDSAFTEVLGEVGQKWGRRVHGGVVIFPGVLRRIISYAYLYCALFPTVYINII
jgi:hypothetical protein